MVAETKRDASEFQCAVTVLEDKFLSNETCGGVVIRAHNNRIVVSNTLADRLLLSYEQMLPTIRKTLFPTPVDQ